MNFIIDILHPAHVHVFRNLIIEMTRRGHRFLVTARRKECALDLLSAYGIPHVVISRQRRGLFGLGVEFISRTLRFWRLARPFKPDYIMGIMGPTVAVAGCFLPSKTVIFYDTEMAKITNCFAYPLADYVCTPECYKSSAGRHQVNYPGYHELAYLHPNRFAPDPSIRKEIGLKPGERLFLMRFVSWQASHDIGEKGLSRETKTRFVRMLSARGRLLISSEAPLPPELQPYRITVPFERLHHVMAAASLLVGESATMASECAVLGVPALFISNSSRGYTEDEEERYGLVRYFNHSQQQEAVACVEAMLGDPDLALTARRGRERLLAEHVDVTGWMIDFFERRP